MIIHKKFEKFSGVHVVNEMAKVGMVTSFDLWMHPREYENEEPHIHVCLANSTKSVAKIQLVPNKPTSYKDLKFIDDNDGGLSKETKKDIVMWANSNNKYGVNNWVKCLSNWEELMAQFNINE